METPVSYVANSVLARLKAVSIPGVSKDQIHIMPEGRCPARVGERCLIISVGSVTTINTETDFRARRVYFRVNFIRRIRVVPADKRGIEYTDPKEVHDVLTVVEDAIQSIKMTYDLITTIKQQEDRDPNQVRYQISKTFTHRLSVYDPIHLYPGFFEAKLSKPDDSIGGHKFYAAFTSPNFYPVQNPLQCIEE